MSLRHLSAALASLTLALAWPSMSELDARQAPPVCVVTGKVISGTTPLPGVTVSALAGDKLVAAASTAVDGSYKLSVPPGAEYRIAVEMTAFAPGQQTLTFTQAPCDQKADFSLVLASRTSNPGAAPAPSPVVAEPATTSATTPAGQRFSALNVQSSATAAAALEVNPPDRLSEQAIMALLPPGFSRDASTEAVAVTGQMASIDRGMMNDRMGAISRGEFDPATGTFAPTPEGQPGPGDAGGRAGRGGQAGGRGGPGRGGGAGDFVIGGRAGRGQSLFQVTGAYTFSGSALDSPPYQLRSDSPATKNPYSRHNFSMTLGGPVFLPGYNGTNRSTFTLSYSGNRGDNLFDQYATVPSEAQRSGDFSALGSPLINPITGEPFSGNQIPGGMMNPASLALLRFIPRPNLDGTSRNFHYVTTANSLSDNASLRITHNFSASTGRGGRGGGARGGAAGGRGGRGTQGVSVNLTAQVQYSRSENEQVHVFPALGGNSSSSSITVPVNLNIAKGRTQHALNVNYSRTSSDARNHFGFVQDVAGEAGIAGLSTDPLTWGVPSLQFSTFSPVRDVRANTREDTRWAAGYTFTKAGQRHTLRLGGNGRVDLMKSRTDVNAQGAFTFTGLYSSGSPQVRIGGYDFADFLLGMPQQAVVNYGLGEIKLRGQSFSLFAQDDLRLAANLTLNLGVRYELVLPFFETNGRMVNLDTAPGFTAVSPVLSGQAGPYSGHFPKGLIRTDADNVAPRVGFAWRLAQGTILRGGYGISYNAGSYSSMARQMMNQPPFVTANTAIGSAASPLSLTDPLATASPNQITNDYGVDINYVLGRVETWSGDLSKDLTQTLNFGMSYTHIRGSDLDIVRAPNRGPNGLLLAGVQPFEWQSSEGSSKLHAAEFRLTRRPAGGIGAGVTYTWARSRDNASTMGGATVVAQNDKDLQAEWGLSSFDRRHQAAANLSVELPFGTGRRFFTNGGFWAAILGGWRFATNFTMQSGSPLTVRVSGAASTVAGGTNGTLRANYDGSAIQIANPTIDRFFNTAAFSIPAPGTYGNSARNLVIGPGSRLLNANFSRDIRLGGNRSLTLALTANNLLNTVNYGGINTTVNSPSFGQVTSVRGMRSMSFVSRLRF